ncbi:conserved Plasmodium protein, unknown function [Plasmodium gallinaceum]|uniref:Uncharacterized protein n=1 Tax=Plasmodium gallinaceum TaxID=5849 RepID=A0A1J1GMN2_PLAGA|nr:conserved Plasmodium protein, unknown function [Plasmodium gallinaceum]CRG93665.1 conserved Plasmodium protein, unknown function [Plasmodium gallinaceum]
MNHIKAIFYKNQTSRNLFFSLNKNVNNQLKRNMSTDKKNLKDYETNVDNVATNLPKGIRIPIMNYLYGIIFLMAFVPICQSLYETNKYYKENKHLYGKEKS